jgi:hypothetical protein
VNAWRLSRLLIWNLASSYSSIIRETILETNFLTVFGEREGAVLLNLLVQIVRAVPTETGREQGDLVLPTRRRNSELNPNSRCFHV